MHVQKTKLCVHTYQDTTEEQIYVISNVRIDTMVQFKPGLLISSPAGLPHTSRQLPVTNGYKKS